MVTPAECLCFHICEANTKIGHVLHCKTNLNKFQIGSGTPGRKRWRGRGQEDWGQLGCTLCLEKWHNGLRTLSIAEGPEFRSPESMCKRKRGEYGEMAQWLKAVSDFAEDLGSWVHFPTPTLDSLQLLVITVSGIRCSFLASMGTRTTQNKPSRLKCLPRTPPLIQIPHPPWWKALPQYTQLPKYPLSP